MGGRVGWSGKPFIPVNLEVMCEIHIGAAPYRNGGALKGIDHIPIGEPWIKKKSKKTGLTLQTKISVKAKEMNEGVGAPKAPATPLFNTYETTPQNDFQTTGDL